jgi:hypothetical protein
MDGGRYYRPYDSADESGSDSDTASSDTWFSSGMDQAPPPVGSNDGHPNFKAFATMMQLQDAAGRNFSTVRDQIDFLASDTSVTLADDRKKGSAGRGAIYSAYDAPPEDITGEDEYGKTRFDTEFTTQTTLVLIDSRYRDRTAYPQPTEFSLRLPRQYKYITNITLSDVKLLTSFYFFRLTKGNTDITVYEKDRQTLTYEGILQSTIVKRYITQGSYTIDALQNEVQLQLNYTPLFFDYPNGYNDFKPRFRASGDFFVNFNYPGDYFYNNTTNTWVPNPTIDTIVLHFWKTRYAQLSQYSDDQVLLAYYYPVLNEYLFDEDYNNTPLNLEAGIGIDPTITTVDDVRYRILYAFQGITPPDPVVLAVVNANIPALDKYRLQHTFRYWLVNKYVVSRDTRSQNVFITSPSLNTSIVNLLIQQNNYYFQAALIQYGITSNQYLSIASNINKTNAVLQGMYYYLQTQFYTYFAVPWSQYTLGYYANLSNEIFIQNGLNVTGVASNDAQAIASGIVSYSNDILLIQSSNPTYYWSNLSSLTQSTIFMLNLSTSTSSFNTVYDVAFSNILSNTPLIDSNTGYFYTDYLTNSANAVCPIDSAKYTVFKFHSPVRQTLQVETLPRPTQYRIIQYNQSNYNTTINKYFDLSYSYVFTPTTPYAPTNSGYTYAFDNLPSTTLLQIPGWADSNALSNNVNYSYGRSKSASLGYYSSNNTLDFFASNNTLYTTFISPEVLGSVPASNYTYSMNVSVQFYTSNGGTTLIPPGSNFRMFLYHDRGGFQGDMAFPRQESDKFYKFSTLITTADTSGTISFTAYPQQQYYLSLRADSITFPAAYVRIAPWFSSNFTSTVQTRSIDGINPGADVFNSNFPNQIQSNWNYAQVYDSNWIRLPIQSNLWQPDPSSNTNNMILPVSNMPIGYDSNGISTDYTDYIPFVNASSTLTFDPAMITAIDPINQFLFQSNTPYNSTTKDFLTPPTNNAIYTPQLATVYTPTSVAARQYKIAHYYSVNYLPEPDISAPLNNNLISLNSNAQLPYTLSTTTNVPIPGYSYGGGTQSTIQLGAGPLGFSFIPGEGIWNIKKAMFRTAISNSAEDPNQNLQFLGVYLLQNILGASLASLSLTTAIAVLSNTARITYTSTLSGDPIDFDKKGGTYYEFEVDTSFAPYPLSNILGYSQNLATMSDQPESTYVFIAFNSDYVPQTIKALSGSVIPYPFYNKPFVSTAYLDGTKAYDSNYGVVFPSTIGQTNWPFATSLSTLFAPAPGNDGTMSQYALSMPIGTSILPLKVPPLEPAQDFEYIYPWSNTLTPTQVVANASNSIMLQDTNYAFYSIDRTSPIRTLSTPTWVLSADDIYPTGEQTSIVGVAGNTYMYYFLGFSNYTPNNIIRIKQFNPYTGVLSEYPLDTTFTVGNNGTVQSFTMNDYQHFTMTYKKSDDNTTVYYSVTPSTNMAALGTFTGPSTAVHVMAPVTSTLYMMPKNITTGLGSSIFRTAPITASFPGTNWDLTGTGVPSGYTNFTVTYGPSILQPLDRLTFYTTEAAYNSNLFYSSNWTTGPNTIEIAAVGTFITKLNGTGNPITSITNGYAGSFWLTASNQINLWGARNTEVDLTGSVGTAWQIFYPFQKVVLEQVANSYNAITDLTLLNYPEYPHTAMFYYRDGVKYDRDTKQRWGLENNSNFIVGDSKMEGYYFNSYIFNVPLVASSNTDYQYLTVRGYSPTETSETLIRFVLPNRYDFGYPTQLDLITEIALWSNSPQLFNSNYGSVLSNFNNSFIQSNSYFGLGLLANFGGSNYDTSNFQGFASNVSTIYSSYQSNANLLSNITATVNSNIVVYMSTQLSNFLPPSAWQRQNFTGPLVFSLLWKNSLLPQYANLTEDWGLGYNLGYAKKDTPFSTYHKAESFYKILEDYIYLRMNPEWQLNRIDTTFREDFNITRDSTGSVQNFLGKLILNNFNTFSQTFIFNNQSFNPPIGRLESVYFQWADFAGQQIDNNDCEWTATLVITEQVSKASTRSTIPALPQMEQPRK